MAYQEKPVASIQTGCTAVTTTSASIGTTSVLVKGSNPLRKGFILWNNGANSCYVSFSDTSSSSTCTYIVPTFASLTFCYPIAYTGPISVIRNTGTGTVTLTELIGISY